MLVAAVVTLIATARGPGLSPDSAEYLSSGLNLASGHGLHDFGGVELTLYPPGLPGVVAVAHLLGLSAQSSVRFLNVGAFACIVWLGFLLLRRHVYSRLLVITATALSGISAPLLSVAQMVWTEPVFIVISLCLVLVLEHLVSSLRTIPGIVLAAALVWLAFAFRYVGIASIVVGGIALFVGRLDRGRRAALASAASFVLISGVIPLVWIARNLSVDGTYMGPRPPSSDGVSFVGRYMGTTLDNWLLPSSPPALLQRAAQVAMILGFALLLLALRHQRRRELLFPERSGQQLVPLVAFVATYAVWLVVSELTTEIDAPGTRLMSPLYLPLLVIAAVAVDRLWMLVPKSRRRHILPIGAALLFLLTVDQGLAFAREARTSRAQGVGYATQSWRSSQLVQAAGEVPAYANLYSNDPWALWIILRRQPVLQTPYRTAVSVQGIPTLGGFVRGVDCNTSYLAWFTDDPFVLSGRFTPEQLGSHVEVRTLAVERDGTLYELGPQATISERRSRCSS
jgi:hypothetical protein